MSVLVRAARRLTADRAVVSGGASNSSSSSSSASTGASASASCDPLFGFSDGFVPWNNDQCIQTQSQGFVDSVRKSDARTALNV